MFTRGQRIRHASVESVPKESLPDPRGHGDSLIESQKKYVHES